MILAGDIGGTNSRIGLFSEASGRLRLETEEVYPSRAHSGLAEIVGAFLAGKNAIVSRAAFGVAGPIVDGKVMTPNLPWSIDQVELSRRSGVADLFLINDLQAHASGVDDLVPSDFVALNEGSHLTGNAAFIAAGTGLGEAGLYWDGTRRHAFPCEGGHADFAPRNELEFALLQYLARKFGHVSYERILSGPGLKNVYDFLRDCGREAEPAALREELAQAPDAAAAISRHGMNATFAICERALDTFISVYGAEAGNLALKIMAIGGLFVSGGIAARILPRLPSSTFMRDFTAKGRLQPVLEQVPVRVVTNDRVGLIGAARYAHNAAAGLASQTGAPR